MQGVAIAIPIPSKLKIFVSLSKTYCNIKMFPQDVLRGYVKLSLVHSRNATADQ